MDITYSHEMGLMFAIYYSRSQWNRKIICQLLFFIQVLRKLISKIVIHLKQTKKKDWRVLIGHPQDQGKCNLYSVTSNYF